MTEDIKISNLDMVVQEVNPKRNIKRKKASPLAIAIGSVLSFVGTVAPDTTAKIFQKIMFSPSKGKLHDSARAILDAARIEQTTIGNDTVVHYIWGDSEQRILLVHGWSGDASHMTSFVQPLRDAGYQVVALDMPAHGKSSGNASSVAHFERCIANVGKTYGPFQGVIAHSMGAAAVTYALSRGLQGARVVFLGPVSHYESVWKNFQRMTNLPRKVVSLAVQKAEQWLDVSFAEIDPLKLAPSMSVPLLVVHDHGDRECPFEDSTALVASWPQAKIVATENMGHMRGLRDPDVVRQTIAFVTEPTQQ